MKTKIFSVGLALLIIASMLFSIIPVSAGELAWGTYTIPSTSNLTLTAAGLDVLDVAVAGDGTTIYAATGAIGGRLYKSTNGGKTWSAVTATNLPNPVNLVAVAPDDANIVVAAGGVSAAGGVTANLSISASTNGGSSWSAITPAAGNWDTTEGSAPVQIFDVAISQLTAGVRWVGAAGADVVVGAASAGGTLFAFNLGSAVPAWVDTVNRDTWNAGAGLNAGFAAPVPDAIRAVAFSPYFGSDMTAVAVSEVFSAGVQTGRMRLHIISFNLSAWDAAAAFASYPVALETGAAATAFTVNNASISLDPAYLGGDDSLRVGFIGASITSPALTEIGGIYRSKDTSIAQILDLVGIQSVSWNGTNLVAGPTATNTVRRSADALATSPTISSASAYKRPGIDAQSTNVSVAWAGANAVAGSVGNGSAFAISADNGATFLDTSLIDTALTTIEDLQVSADGANIYMLTSTTPRATGISSPAAGVAVGGWLMTRLAGNIITFAPGSIATAGTVWAAAGAIAAGDDLSQFGALAIAAGDTLGAGTIFTASLTGNVAVAGAVQPLAALAGGTLQLDTLAGLAAGATVLGGVALTAGVAPLTGSWTIGAADTFGIGTAPSTLANSNLTSLFKKTDAWYRTFGINNVNGYLIRVAPDNKDVLYIADNAGGTTMFYTENGGGKWFQRTSRYAVADLAVESIDTAYVAVNAATSVSKTTNKGFTWGDSKGTGVSAGNVYSIKSLAKDKLIVGSTQGYVAYSTDGNANWTKIDTQLANADPTLAIADKLDSGGFIWAATDGATADSSVQRWTIGSSTSWKAMAPVAIETTGGNMGARGINLQDGVLFVYMTDSVADAVADADAAMTRSINPTADAPAWNNLALPNDTGSVTPIPVAIALSSGGNLWAVDTQGADSIQVYQDTLTTAKPELGLPADSAVVSYNPISGNINSVELTWARPFATTSVAASYGVQIALDADFNQLVVDQTAAGAGVWPAVATTSSTISLNTGAAAIAWTPDPNTKYYWRVRVEVPERSNWSVTKTFSSGNITAAPMEIIKQPSAAPPITITQAAPAPAPIINLPAPVVNIPAAPPATTITIPPAVVPAPIAPAYIWAIVIIGAILVIAVIVLIIRTRRPV